MKRAVITFDKIRIIFEHSLVLIEYFIDNSDVTRDPLFKRTFCVSVKIAQYTRVYPAYISC